MSPELAALLVLFGGLIGGIGSYRCNRLAAAQDAAEKLVPASAHEIGLNHHLARLAGNALKTIIEEAAKTKPTGSADHSALVNAAERATSAWLLVNV